MTTSPRRIRLQVAAAPILMVVAALSPLLVMLPVSVAACTPVVMVTVADAALVLLPSVAATR